MTASPMRPPVGTLALGVALLSAGLLAAVALLPEWRIRPPGDPGAAARVRADVESLGATFTRARADLASRPDAPKAWERAYRVLERRGVAWLAESGGAALL